MLRVVGGSDSPGRTETGHPQYVGGACLDDDGDGESRHTYSRKLIEAVAGDLAAVGFIGAVRYCEVHDLVDVATALADIQMALEAGERVRSVPGLLRYLVTEAYRQRRRFWAAVEG